MADLHGFEETWDAKRIVFGIAAAVLAGSGILYGANVLGFNFFNPQSQSNLHPPKASETPKNVLGAETKEEESPSPTGGSKSEGTPFSLPSKEQLEEKLEEVKKQVSSLSVTEIASSSPQIQKVLQDLKALEEYPHNQVKDVCAKICSSL